LEAIYHLHCIENNSQNIIYPITLNYINVHCTADDDDDDDVKYSVNNTE